MTLGGCHVMSPSVGHAGTFFVPSRSVSRASRLELSFSLLCRCTLCSTHADRSKVQHSSNPWSRACVAPAHVHCDVSCCRGLHRAALLQGLPKILQLHKTAHVSRTYDTTQSNSNEPNGRRRHRRCCIDTTRAWRQPRAYPFRSGGGGFPLSPDHRHHDAGGALL